MLFFIFLQTRGIILSVYLVIFNWSAGKVKNFAFDCLESVSNSTFCFFPFQELKLKLCVFLDTFNIFGFFCQWELIWDWLIKSSCSISKKGKIKAIEAPYFPKLLLKVYEKLVFKQICAPRKQLLFN